MHFIKIMYETMSAIICSRMGAMARFCKLGHEASVPYIRTVFLRSGAKTGCSRKCHCIPEFTSVYCTQAEIAQS
jgi:hypothetical protein